MSEKQPEKFTWTSAVRGNGYELHDGTDEIVAKVVLREKPADHGKPWKWIYYYAPDRSTGDPPTGLAATAESARAICEAIAAGTGEPRIAARKPSTRSVDSMKQMLEKFPDHPFSQGLAEMIQNPGKIPLEYEEPDHQYSRNVMKTSALRDYHWKRSGLMEYDLKPRPDSEVVRAGHRATRIAYIGDPIPESYGGRMLWYWAFHLPAECMNGNPALYGTAHSIDAAKVICETIAAATVESRGASQEIIVDKPFPDRLPFKHGVVADDGKRRALEKLLKFRFPADLLASYGDWGGGNLDGLIVFDTTACAGMVFYQFLAISDADRSQDSSVETVVGVARTNSYLKRFPLEKLPYIPFAIVCGAEGDEEDVGPYNVPSLLVFERASKDVCLLSGYQDRKVRVAKTWKKFAESAEYRFEE